MNYFTWVPEVLLATPVAEKLCRLPAS